MSLPAPAAGMHAFHLDSRVLLFSEARQDLHVLNEAGTLLWQLLGENRDALAIRESLAEALGLTGREAEAVLHETLAQWTAKGLLATEEAMAAPLPAAVLPPPGGASAAPLRPSLTSQPVQRCYRLLDTCFRIGFPTAALAGLVHPCLSHLAMAKAPASGQDQLRLDVVPQPSGAGLVLYRDGEACGACADPEGLAPLVKGEVWAQAVNRQDGVLLGLHAGVVAQGGGALLLPGASGSGKSTLTALLVAAGFTYFSDEIALLRDGDLQVMPVPLPLCVKQGGVGPLLASFPALAEARFHWRADGKRVTYLPPPPSSLPPPGRACPVRAVVFPRYTPGEGPAEGEAARCERLAALAALERLLAECLLVGVRLDVARIGALVRWIGATPCFALRYAHSAQGLDGIRRILAEVAADPRGG